MSHSSSQEFGSTTTSSSQSDPKHNPKPILHPEFSNGENCTNDTFWLKKLYDASYGKFPRQVTYQDGILRFRPKGKPPISKTLSSDPGKCCREFISFLRSEANIISDNDNECSRQISLLSSQLNQNRTEITWSKMRDKTRQNLIERFVNEQTKRKELTYDEKELLFKTIKNGITLEILTNDCFYLNNGEIESISRLYYNPNTRSFFLDDVTMGENIKRFTGFTPAQSDNVFRRRETQNNVELLYIQMLAERAANRPIA